MKTFVAIPFSGVRIDLLQRALASVPPALLKLVDVKAKMDPDLIATNNMVMSFSPGKTYAQSMVDFQRFAREREAKFWLHQHADGAATLADYGKLIHKAELLNRAGARWAAIFTHHDVLACYNTAAIEEIGGWDQTFPMYFFDNNNYRRLAMAGFEFVQMEEHGVIHGDNGVGSHTINADKVWKRMNDISFPMYAEMYRQMWGGDPGRERFSVAWQE